MQQFASTLFAQANPDAAAAAGAMMFILLIEIALGVLVIAGMWAVFAKAGKPGWAAIIPVGEFNFETQRGVNSFA